MGSPATERDRNDDESPHRVTISRPFYLQITELTVGQQRRLVPPTEAAPEPSDESPHRREEPFTDARLGMGIAAADGILLALRTADRARRYRLPSEAEWEYACRAGTTTPFWTGTSITTSQANFDGERPYADGARGVFRGRLAPAGSFPANPWGLYDLHGNAMELCQDWYGPYATAAVTDPRGPATGKARVLRGGSERSAARDLRSAARSALALETSSIGLRLVAETSPR
jgi:formylglycine-generating enzyme required for sulfatase activity